MPRPSNGLVGHALLATRSLQIICLLVCIGLASKSISTIVDAGGQTSPAPQLVGMLAVVCFGILYCAITLVLYWDHQLPLLATATVDGLFFIALLVSCIVIGKPLSYTSCSSSSPVLANNTPPAPAPAPAPPAPPATAVVPTTEAIPTPWPTVTAATVSATVLPGSGPASVTGSDGKVYTITGRSLSRMIRRALEVIPPPAPAAPAATAPDTSNLWLMNSATSESQCQIVKAMWGFGIVLTVLFVFTGVMVAFVWRAERRRSSFVSDSKDVGDA